MTRRFVPKHYRKLLFGTDRFVRQEEPLMIEVLKNLELPTAMAEAIFTTNAVRLLRGEKPDSR
jgi:predicted TIM-barrel fold metal-dependent hydrolase